MKMTFLVNEDRLRKAAERVPIIHEGMQAPGGYEAAMLETCAYLDTCKSEWEANYDISHDAMKGITGFSRKDMTREFNVYVVHPNIPTECSKITRKGRIYEMECPEEGGPGSRENHTTIQLWHRILHSYLPKDGIAHAIIELATDNHLNLVLNGGDSTKHLGDRGRYELRKDFWKPWCNHQDLKRKDIRRFYEQMKRLKAAE